MDEKIKAFLDEIEAVYRNHGLSLAHEDDQGGFIIEPLSEHNIEWLRDAAVNEAVLPRKDRT